VHVDHLGSVEALTNEAGAVVQRRSYDAFGARRKPAWGAPPPASFTTTASLGFTGHEDDAELGLVNMKGRLYDPHLSRFLTPDSIVAHPAFGQSWNPYSYVLNGPLSHVDPTGFTEEPADAVVSPGGFLIIPETNDEPYVDMVWQVFAVGAEPEEPSEAPDSGATVLPQDANTWGNNAGWLPQPAATAQELPRQNSVGLEIYIGVAQGTAELALDTAKSLVLNALTFGGYGTWQFGKAIWAGYQDDRYVGALNAVNPLYQLARGGADAYMAAERENYRAAGAAGVKTVVLGAAAVVGAAQGVGALAEGAAAGGARGASAITKGAQVTEQVIREVMKDAPLVSQQAGGVSLPIIRQYLDKLLAGEVAPAIKVDGKMIVDGNHRYIAGRILGREPAIQPWAGGRPGNAVPWETIPIDPKAWP